jgi:hypothetical protein
MAKRILKIWRLKEGGYVMKRNFQQWFKGFIFEQNVFHGESGVFSKE